MSRPAPADVTSSRVRPSSVAAPLDISSTPRISFTRLVRVELRKITDTRSGFWLLIAIVVLTAGILAVFFFTAADADRIFLNFTGVTSTPQGFLLPVLGILLVTSEWTQRTALTTFTLVPRRGTVIGAKVVAALFLGLAAIAVALSLAAIATALAGTDDAWTGIGVDTIAKFALLQVSGVILGLAFGLLFLNSAAAIVTFFVLPLAFTIVANLWSALSDAAPWVDINTAQQPLFSTDGVTGEQWWQLVVASTIWIVAPFVLGLIRVMRAEVK